MNVGLIIYGSLDIMTGGFLYDRKLVEFLRSQGDTVEVFTLPWRTYPRHILQNFSGRICSWARSVRLDVLLEDELNHPSLFLVNKRVKEIVSCPVVSIVHHLRSSELRPQWQNRLYRSIESRYLQRVDGYVFPSLTTARSVQSLAPLEKPYLVANPGKDNVASTMSAQYVQARSMNSSPLRILFVGNLIPRKGLHVLIDGLARIPVEQWRLQVVGSLAADRRYSRHIEEKIREQGLESNVILLGTVTGAELSKLYGSSHLLAVPSSYEGFGIVYLEGMAFGLPSLASTAGAASELICHGVNGFLVDPEDSMAISNYLGMLISDRDKLSLMGMAALEQYKRHPTWLDTARRIRSFLEGLADCSA